MVKKTISLPWSKSFEEIDRQKKVQASNPKRYRGKKNRTKTQGPELEAKTDCKNCQSELEGYIFDIGPIALDKFARTMKELEWYIEGAGVVYWSDLHL